MPWAIRCDSEDALQGQPKIVEHREWHDGASVHTAGIVKQLLVEMGIKVMNWPPYSPDLNPIENLWALLKAEIYKLYPELQFANDTEETLKVEQVRVEKQSIEHK